MTSYSEARDAWFASREGKQCLDLASLRVPARCAQYLKNRLELAFIAGMEAGERTARERSEAAAQPALAR